MYECIRPYQFVKEDKNDYLIFKGNRFFIRTKYAGVVETTKDYYNKLKDKGMEEK